MIFTVEDFKGIKMPMTNGKITTDIVRLDEALVLINRKFEEWLKTQPMVFGQVAEISGYHMCWGSAKTNQDTHAGRLVNVGKVKDNE